MPRWIAALHLFLLTMTILGSGQAQEQVSIVPSEDVARVVPQIHRMIAVRLEGVSMGAALRAVAQRAELSLTYNDRILPSDRKVWLSAAEIRTDRALDAILQGSGLKLVALTSGQIVVVKEGGARAKRLWQPGVATVHGRVSAKETGVPIAGANVVLSVADTSFRAITSDSGTFAFTNIPSGTHTVTVRYIGYHPLVKKAVVESVPVYLEFALEARAVALDELVTTATGQQRRRDLGNAITTIHADSVLRSAPIRNLTDLLENRVPGLTTQHTTGAPGDPSRLRLRGIGSVLRGNDPVVIVDNVRIDAAQSEARSGNLTNFGCTTVRPDGTSGNSCSSSRGDSIAGVAGNLPAPSPLDQIDPNIIEKIEVFKGPSAATLYGADAANGVIVITTKRGKPGPTRWHASLTRGRTVTPGRWPEGYYRWGRSLTRGGVPRICALLDDSCIQDSLVRFQALNESDLTILGQGRRTAVSLTASGGTQALTYSITGTYDDEIGLLQLPTYEVERFRTTFDREAPEWMREPHRLTKWSVTSNFRANLSPTADVTLSSSLSRTDQQRSGLETKAPILAGVYVDRVQGLYIRPNAYLPATLGDQYTTWAMTSNLLQDYYTRTTASSINVLTSLSANWRPQSWLNVSGQAGINLIPRDDERYLPTGLPTKGDSGVLIRGNGRMLISTFNLQGQVRRPVGWGFTFETNVGANLNTTNAKNLITSATYLVPGTASIANARYTLATENATTTSVFGWYIEPRFIGQRLSISTGIRLDGGSAYGTRVTSTGGLGNLLSLPKLNGSWVVSEEPFFPFKSLFSSLRLRASYGQAQVQPSAYDRLRIYTGRVDDRVLLSSLGNTDLKPERSVEFEGGFDADLLDSRLSLELTGYRKTQVDALMQVLVPLSVNGGGSIIKNIGNISNRGLEAVLRVTPMRASLLTWSAQLTYTQNDNTLVKLGNGVLPNKVQGLVEGYPVGGRWAKPILGYVDQNENDVVDPEEIMVGDSLMFMGRLYPKYLLTLSTNVVLFGGAVDINAGFDYNTGGTQIDQTASANWVLSRALSDPSAPFSEQAAVVAATGGMPGDFGFGRTDYGLIQDLSTFRFHTLAVTYHAPTRIARLFRAQQLTLGVQGANLGLHTSYRGKDPNVNSWSPGESIVDTGQLPQPRTWQLVAFLQF